MDLDGSDPSNDSGAKRRLDMNENSESQNEDGGNTLPMITEGINQEENIIDTETDRTKRTKKARADSPSYGLAGSLEGLGRAQC
jgi:hypothetical protein